MGTRPADWSALAIESSCEQMIETETQAESGGLRDRHWVVLRSRIDRAGGNVKMKIFTYGDGDYQVPKKGVLPLDDFLMNTTATWRPGRSAANLRRNRKHFRAASARSLSLRSESRAEECVRRYTDRGRFARITGYRIE